MNAGGTGLVYSTLLSGSAPERANSLGIDGQGNAYVTGTTEVPDFPLASGAFDRGGDFLTKLNSDGSGLLYSTLLPSGFGGQDVAADFMGNIYLLGSAGYVSRFQGSPVRPPAIFGVANAALRKVGRFISPGALISIYGSGIGPEQPAGMQVDAGGKASMSLGGVEVRFGGAPAPLASARHDQIDAVVPSNLPWTDFGVVPIEVLKDGVPAGRFQLWRTDADPEVFPAPRERFSFLHPWPLAAALNEDGSLNSIQNPARFGTVVTVFATGLGPMEPYLDDGLVSMDFLPFPRLPVLVGVAYESTTLDVQYAGQAPGQIAGVMQVNFRLPPIHSQNPLPLYLQVGDYSSELFAIHVTP